jgi:serine/threonine protein kinase
MFPLALRPHAVSSSIPAVQRRCLKCGTVFSAELAFCGNDGSVLVLDLPPEKADPRLGQQLGDYVLAAPVADGATGRVYEGRHAQTREKVAVKILHDAVARDRIAVERFKRESEAGKLMSHPHIVSVIDFGSTSDGSHFMTMEFLHGEELGEVFRRQEVLPAALIVRLVCQIAVALDYAHSFGYVHRDLKPDNIFLCRSDDGTVVKLLDFGSVKMQVQMGPKLTAIGTTLGSPFYMSPEQAMGKQDLDQRSDVFALGAILYEMLTGQVAFGARNIAEVLMKILQQHPAPPSTVVATCPAAIDPVMLKALAKDKGDRYATALELANALCQAYGLDATAEHWAQATQVQIAKAMSSAKAPVSTPARPSTSSTSPARVRLETRPEFDDDWTGSSNAIPQRSLLGPALVGVVLAGALAWLVLWWLKVV